MSNNLLIHTNDTFTAKSGAAVRFEDIFEGISKEISRYRFKGGRHLSDQEIEDLRQEAFKKAIISVGSYDPQRSFGCPQAYGYAIALSCEKNVFRKTVRRNSVLSSQPAECEGGEEFGSDREFESKEALSYIKSKIAKLPKNQRKVLELSIQGVEPEKISQLLDCSQNAVYSRLCRARLAIAEALGKTFLSEYGFGTKTKTCNISRTENSTAVIFLKELSSRWVYRVERILKLWEQQRLGDIFAKTARFSQTRWKTRPWSRSGSFWTILCSGVAR